LNTATQPRLVLELKSLSSYLRSREMAQALLLLTAAGVTWLMTLATVASLTRGRAHRRAREFAIHLALGANRRTLASVALLESLLLGLIAAAAALIGAWPLISWTARVLPDTLLLIRPIQFDLRTVVILAAAAAAALVVMVLA
jgi:predicted lysophospholipase L1 biosynthesis ABC-type transport system permease subunit